MRRRRASCAARTLSAPCARARRARLRPRARRHSVAPRRAAMTSAVAARWSPRWSWGRAR
eukprot:4356908-Prymnesium_polylepis.1